MRLPVLTAADGAPWEAGLVMALEQGEHPVTVVRRCVDLVDLLAVAASGQARAALVAAGLRRLDADAVDRLLACGVTPVAVLPAGDAGAAATVRALGIEHTVGADAAPAVVARVLEQAVTGRQDGGRPRRAFSVPVASAPAPDGPADEQDDATPAGRRGSVIAVWGPTGAPGRTTVAVGLADELARLGLPALVVDADVYGGVVATVLGLLDESPGIAAACRQASSSRFSAQALADLAWQLSPQLRVLTGIPRAERWPELRPAAIGTVLGAARELAEYTVVDCGFCLETDEELSFDTLAPRRNGATLAVLDEADLILVVGAADPPGVQRVVRGLSDLRDAEVAAPVWVVLNKVRKSTAPGNPGREAAATLERFAGRTPAACLPWDPSAVDRALAAGRTVADAAPKSALRASLAELAAAVAGVPAENGRRRRRTR